MADIIGKWLGETTLAGVKGLFEGAGQLAKDIRSAITGEADPETRAKLDQIATQLDSLSTKGQLEINLQEAKHPKVFVSGWRPAIGWVCAASLFAYFVPQYVMASVLWVKHCWTAESILPYPVPDAEGLIELVAGLLGLALWRTAEKIKGVARS